MGTVGGSGKVNEDCVAGWADCWLVAAGCSEGR